MTDVAVSDGNSAPAAAGPTTFAEAFAADASSASNPPDQSSTPVAAVTPPAEGVTPAGEDERSPLIPRPRFDEVNTERNALKQWKEQYAWVEQIPREQLEGAIRFYAQFHGDDPVEALRTLASKLHADPVHGQKLRSYAAQTLAAARKQQSAPTPDYSQVIVDLGNGQSLSLADFKNNVLAEAEQKFAPVAQTVEQYKAEQAKAEQARKVEQFTNSTFDDIKTWPGMDDPANLKAVGEALKELRIDGEDEREVMLALNRVYRTVVLPKLGSKAESQLLDTLKTKAAANTSVNPGAATSAAPADIRSFHDPRLKW